MEEKRNWKNELMDYSNWKLRNKIILNSLLIGSIIFMVLNFKIDIIWWIPLENYPLTTSIRDVTISILILSISGIITFILILIIKRSNKKEEDILDV